MRNRTSSSPSLLDLTERKRAEEKARESERRYHEVEMELAHTNRVATMGQLSASIAHEVSQPIAAAFTNAQAGLRWLSAEPPDVEEVRQALGRIVKDVDRAGEVIGRIRALIKKAPPRKDSVAMNDAIREVIALTRGEAAEERRRGADPARGGLAAHSGRSGPTATGDPQPDHQRRRGHERRGRRAARACDQHGDAEAGDVRVAVRDSGPGLDPAKLERLFEAFYTTKPGGLGMGLSICRSIIEAHGGRLWAEANEPRGAIFQFTVPGRS